MAQQTIYLSDEDEQIWQEARKLAAQRGKGWSISRIATQALADYLEGSGDRPWDCTKAAS